MEVHYFWLTNIELFGAIFGIAYIFLNAREIIWAWPVGILSVATYVYVFASVFLLGDFLLHIAYLVLSIYGWFQWHTGAKLRKGKPLPVTRSAPNELALAIVIASLGAGFMGFLFQLYPQASVPYLDAITTSFSLLAQWQTARKKIESWGVWLFVNALSAGIYWYKDLTVTAVLYAIYFLLAIYGYHTWKKSMEMAASEHQNHSGL